MDGMNLRKLMREIKESLKNPPKISDKRLKKWIEQAKEDSANMGISFKDENTMIFKYIPKYFDDK